jgi:hypothetical protein
MWQSLRGERAQEQQGREQGLEQRRVQGRVQVQLQARVEELRELESEQRLLAPQEEGRRSLLVV